MTQVHARTIIARSVVFTLLTLCALWIGYQTAIGWRNVEARTDEYVDERSSCACTTYPGEEVSE